MTPDGCRQPPPACPASLQQGRTRLWQKRYFDFVIHGRCGTAAGEKHADDVVGGVAGAAGREEPRDGRKIVAGGDEGRFGTSSVANLREADVGEQAVADALSAYGVIEVSALGKVDGDGLASASVADVALGSAVSFAQEAQVADAGTLGADVGFGGGALQRGDLEGKPSGRGEGVGKDGG